MIWALELGARDIDLSLGAGECRADAQFQIGEGEAQVAGEEVPGSGRHECNGDAGAMEDLRHCADRAVTAGDDHHGGASAERLAGAPLPGVLPARLEPDGGIPAGQFLLHADGGLQTRNIGFGRVADHDGFSPNLDHRMRGGTPVRHVLERRSAVGAGAEGIPLLQ